MLGPSLAEGLGELAHNFFVPFALRVCAPGKQKKKIPHKSFIIPAIRNRERTDGEKKYYSRKENSSIFSLR